VAEDLAERLMFAVARELEGERRNAVLNLLREVLADLEVIDRLPLEGVEPQAGPPKWP
jgi:hypothetical protein